MANDHDPRFIIVIDKILVRYYTEKLLPGSGLFDHRLYDGYDRTAALDAIEKNSVIKISNGWHQYRFVFDTWDREKINAAIDDWLKKPMKNDEWAYRFCRPGFTVEKIIEPVNTVIKVFCFHGKAWYFWFQTYDVSKGNVDCTASTLYDQNFKKLNAPWEKLPDPEYPHPQHMEKRIREISEILARDFDHMRVDLFYNYSEDKIYMSEIVPYTGRGTTAYPEWVNVEMGNRWRN